MSLELIVDALLEDTSAPIGDEEYAAIYHKFVVEPPLADLASDSHLTPDAIEWIMSPSPEWSLVRARYEYEKIITGAHGNDMFLELTYVPQSEEEFPHAAFYFHKVPDWYVYFVDFVTATKQTKAMIRMSKREDMQDVALHT